MLISLPVDIFTGMFKIIFPATSLLFIVVIPCPVKITLFILGFTPCAVISLFTSENISSTLASIISINSELFITLLFSSLQVLSNYLDVQKDDILSIGDNINDIDMFKVSNISVAVNNACDQVKLNANYVAKNSVENGAFAEAIYKFIPFNTNINDELKK